jgi:surface polysaccharide O-acyltransferase-like enzyme
MNSTTVTLSSRPATARNRGVELLRVAATLAIITQHIIIQGVVLYEAAADVNYLKYSLLYLLKNLTLWGSTVFALISGYLCIRSRAQVSSLLRVWLETVFYTVVITAIFALLSPEQVSADQWVSAFFPVINRKYWYITAYAALFLMIPLLNAGILALPRRVLALSLLVATVLFCALPPFTVQDSFSFNSGYSPWWLAFMYVVGAAVRLYGEERLRKVKSRWLFLTIFLCAFLVWVFHPLQLVLGLFPRLQWLMDYLADRAAALQVRTSLPLMLLAVCVFLLFLRVHLSPRAEKLVHFLSAHSLGVYLIHVHPLLFASAYYLFAPLSHLPAPVMVLSILAAAVGVFALCTVLDTLRAALFRALRVDALADRMAAALSRLGNRLVVRLDGETP